MKQQKREPGLTSLDRIYKLKERVFFAISEYETLLYSLKKSFKGKDTDLISNLQKLEIEKLNNLKARVKIFNAHILDLNKLGITVTEIKTEVYNDLNRLYHQIEEYKNEFDHDKIELNKEISQVKKSLRLMGRVRDYTAQRIDITT